MASTYSDVANDRLRMLDDLADPALAIAGPRLDALLFWGIPAIMLAFTGAWAAIAAMLPPVAGEKAVSFLVAVGTILTYAHLIAVAPRAYLNRQVFADNRLRLTIVPILLIAGLALSPTLLVCGTVLAIFWDVHHSAMQTFGLARIYDMKAGNDPHLLRRVDLLLNWALYVGPIGMGAALIVHLHAFDTFGSIGWAWAMQVPKLGEGAAGTIRLASIALWAAVIFAAAFEYRRAMRKGYRMPAHKAALVGTTATVSIAAWACAPPFIAFLAINLFHAIQYFALVWFKEGGRITALFAARPRLARSAATLFGAFCILFGLAYAEAGITHYFLAPFIACSLLHFWYDSFVWSVRKRQV